VFNVYSLKVKQSHYRPGQDLRDPGGWIYQISRQSAHEGGRVVSPTHLPPLPQEIFLVLISIRSWVDPRAIVRPEAMLMKNLNDTIGKRTLDLPACSSVPQPTAPLRVYSLLAYNTLLFLRYLGLSLSSNINISFTHKCVFVCTLSGLFSGHKNLEKSSLMLLYKGRTHRLVCVPAARGNVRSESFTRKQWKENSTVLISGVRWEENTIFYWYLKFPVYLSVCLVVGSLKVLSDLERILSGRLDIFFQLLNKNLLLCITM
jgi:hypothetical protein